MSLGLPNYINMNKYLSISVKLYCMYSPSSSAGKKHNALDFLVVKEIVERPDVAFFSKRVRAQVRVVTKTHATAVSQWQSTNKFYDKHLC